MEERTFTIDLIPFKLTKEGDVFHAFSTIEGYEQMGGYGVTSDGAVLEAILFVNKLQKEMVKQRIIVSRMREEDFKNWVAEHVIGIKA